MRSLALLSSIPLLLHACASPTDVKEAPPVDASHLVFEDTPAALFGDADGTQVLQMDVHNAGDRPTLAATGTLEIAGKHLTAELLPADGSSPRPLGPGEHGLLQVRVWGDTLHRCTDLPIAVTYDPTLDAAHQAPGAHRATVKMPCLRWTTPMDARAIPALRDPSLDPAAVKAAAGKALVDVVSSRISGRADGKLCSDCHYASSAAKYNPTVGEGKADLAIAPDLAIVATQDTGCTSAANAANDHAAAACAPTWARGWAMRFNNNTSYPLPNGGLGQKPAVVRAAFAQWLADGAQ